MKESVNARQIISVAVVTLLGACSPALPSRDGSIEIAGGMRQAEQSAARAENALDAARAYDGECEHAGRRVPGQCYGVSGSVGAPDHRAEDQGGPGGEEGSGCPSGSATEHP